VDNVPHQEALGDIEVRWRSGCDSANRAPFVILRGES